MASTRWIIELDKIEAESGLDWARDFLSHYDTSQLAEIRLGQGRGNSLGVYGRCWYPSQTRPSYRITCQAPGPFPYRIETRQPPIYRLADGSWPPIPQGCTGGLYCEAEARGEIREWRRVIGYTEAQNMEEGIVWIVAHEMYHYLRRTRQLAGRNTEIEADKFADDQLQTLRRLRGRWTRVVKDERAR
jgi:hypothetical protein